MYLWRNSFPNATDISSAYIDKVVDSQIPDLLEHLRMQHSKVLAPQTHSERLYELHVASLIELVKIRIELKDSKAQPA